MDIAELYLTRAGKHRILSREEEAALSVRIQEGDESAWDELVRCNLRLVIYIARRYAKRGLELGDLIQEGNLGLMRAARSFDTDFGTKFSTYATWWIKQSISRALFHKVSLIRIPVHVAEKERIVNRARSQFQVATGYEPSIEELSELTGKSAQEVTSALTARKTVVSYDMSVDSDEKVSPSYLLADKTEGLSTDYNFKDSIQFLLAELSERQCHVVKRRYGLDGGSCATLEEIGQEIGVTRERARQIHNAALSKLRSHALEAELESFLEPS